MVKIVDTSADIDMRYIPSELLARVPFMKDSMYDFRARVVYNLGNFISRYEINFDDTIKRHVYEIEIARFLADTPSDVLGLEKVRVLVARFNALVDQSIKDDALGA